jgi:hypothetical protein
MGSTHSDLNIKDVVDDVIEKDVIHEGTKLGTRGLTGEFRFFTP